MESKIMSHVCWILWQVLSESKPVFGEAGVSQSHLSGLRKCEMKSMGRGKIIVEFFSADIEFNVCKERSKGFVILIGYLGKFRFWHTIHRANICVGTLLCNVTMQYINFRCYFGRWKLGSLCAVPPYFPIINRHNISTLLLELDQKTPLVPVEPRTMGAEFCNAPWVQKKDFIFDLLTRENQSPSFFLQHF